MCGPDRPEVGVARGYAPVRFLVNNRIKLVAYRILGRPIMPQTSTSERQGHSHARSRSIRHKVFCRLPLGQNENDSLDAQIRMFKEREDLRKCLIPGMVSGMSQKACEGRQRQITARSARFMAKIKLGQCKDCKYFSEPSDSPLRRKN